ncbi:MAG: hypothetical protein H6660_07270 [Ardenticatenaceae bacterium]|nr:hypothetical protein [Ardenticatenaceae bacterium]
MDYSKLMSRSWEIVWNNKFLFVLGFLAALGSGGSGGRANSNFRGSSSSDFDLPPGTVDNLQTFWAHFGALIIALICLFVVLGVILWLVRLVAQAGLISSVARIDAGEKVTFGEAFAAGTAKLGRMAGLNLLLYGPFTLLALLSAGILMVMAGTAVYEEVARGGNAEGIFASLGIFTACLIGLACLTLPLLLVVNIVYPFAQRGAVLGELSVMDSIRHGWQVVRANTGEVIVIVLLFLVVGFVFGIVSIAVILPGAVLIFIPAIIHLAAGGGSFGVLEIAYVVAGGVCLAVLAGAINSVLVAFRSTAVTLAYQEFMNKSKLA